MFIVLNNDKQSYAIPLIDFHTHIGKVSIETTKGPSQRINRPQDILDLYEKLKFDLYKRIEHSPDEYYITLPDIDTFVQTLYPVVKDCIYHTITSKGWIADQIVSFPFNDIFHLQTNPKFVKSNEYVRHAINKFEYLFRFIPFCRVDATESKASEEVIKSAIQGAKGLKLHPLSQNWIDKIVTNETKSVLQTAGKLHLPIIFDVPNKGVAADITEISIKSREEADYPINVVLGHNGFDYSSKEIFDNISQQNMFTEISGMRGSDIHIFFKNVMEIDHWSDKILYGTDSNYFSVLQAGDFISYLLSNKFLDLLHSKYNSELDPLPIIANILGLNALKLLPLNYQNSKELGFKSVENEINSCSISNANFITSLKKLVQDKNTILSSSLIRNDKSLEQVITICNNQVIHRFSLHPKDSSIINITPRSFDKATMDFELDPEVIMLTGKENVQNNLLNVDKKDIRTIKTLEEILI